ncbi:TPA: hypothetical protein LET79_000456 [Staphylococcus pseudintermedius]|nr:hypothetical protein [Staphylococcus pseudintermedius]
MEKRVKKNNNWKFLLSKEEIETMRKGVFKKSKYNFPILIPKEFITYLEELDATANLKAKALLLYAGVILVYKEAYHTYRVHHLNLEVICQFLGIKYSEKLRKLFSKNSYLVKNQYITDTFDYPIAYEYSYIKDEKSSKNIYLPRYIMKKSLSQDELEKKLTYKRLQLPSKSIEPTRHTKGVFEKKGNNYQLVVEPLDINGGKYITIDYKTIKDVVYEEFSAPALYVGCVIKDMLANKITTSRTRFRTSKSQLAKKVSMGESTFDKYHRELRRYTRESYRLSQETFKSKEGFVSEVYLYFDCRF